MSKWFKVAALVFILLAAGSFFLVKTAPPRNLTASNMLVTKRRIIQFARQHDRLPATLSELPPPAGHDNEMLDAWKQPLDYSISEAGSATLRSLGADQSPGGDGDNEDIIGVFTARDAEGRWHDEFAPWIHDPLKQ